MRTLQIFAAALATCTIVTPVLADDTAFDMEKLSCFDVVSLAEEDSLFVTALLIGYMSGKSGAAETTPAAIQKAVEAFDTTCGENPDMLAIDALS